jgi:hypothetical protein
MTLLQKQYARNEVTRVLLLENYGIVNAARRWAAME